jgi:hypothetical protein
MHPKLTESEYFRKCEAGNMSQRQEDKAKTPRIEHSLLCSSFARCAQSADAGRQQLRLGESVRSELQEGALVRLQSLADLSHGHAVIFEKLVDYVEYLDSKRSLETGRRNLRGLFGVLADVVRLGDDATTPTLEVEVDPDEQIWPAIETVLFPVCASRNDGQVQLRVFVKGHTRRRESHPVGDLGDVQVVQLHLEIVHPVDAAGFCTDLFACCQQRRILREALVVTDKDRLVLDQRQLVDPNGRDL